MTLALPHRQQRDWQTTDDVSQLRFAVIGLGGFARRRALPAIEATEFCSTTAVVSGDPEKATTVASEYEADSALTYEEFRAGEDDHTYDAVYIATPNALHLEDAAAAADLGKAVLCEKPLEATVERAERLVTACREADVRLMTAYRMQVDPMVRFMRDVVAGGHLGNIVKIHGEFSIDVIGSENDTDQWRLDADLAGGGCLMDVGVYPLNATRFVLDSEPVAVSGTVASPDAGFESVEEHVSWWAKFEGPQRPTGVFTASYQAHLEDTLQILGTDGQLRLTNAFGTETTRTLQIESAGETRTYRGPQVNEIAAEFDYFAHAVDTRAPIEPDGEDGLQDVISMSAIYESAQSGQHVSL